MQSANATRAPAYMLRGCPLRGGSGAPSLLVQRVRRVPLVVAAGVDALHEDLPLTSIYLAQRECEFALLAGAAVLRHI